jgi:hypothetical protein
VRTHAIVSWRADPETRVCATIGPSAFGRRPFGFRAKAVTAAVQAENEARAEAQ